MAILFPTFENIQRLKVPPTEGELSLLNFLVDSLDNNYEVYFHPFLNGDNPDIILLRKNSGVVIFEVKDWNLSNYEVIDKTRWKVKKNGALILSPLEQVARYKNNIYNIHIERLFELNISNPKHFSFVSCALYFHNSDKTSLHEFLISKFNEDEDYKNNLDYYELLGNDSLNENFLNQLINRRKLNISNPLFSDDLYLSFTRYFQPTWHQLEEGIEINYSAKQKELTLSSDREQKVSGVAGSGKTMVLAKRAINANIRTKSKILILTFNISLRNYLHDKLNEVREKFLWNDFVIINYHQFIKDNCNNYNVPLHSISDYENVNLFEQVKNEIRKYRCIFIDEIQDYRRNWITIIRKYFLDNPGEYFVFADEKQNIYDRELLKDKKPYTGVGGQWNKLNESFRLCNEMISLVECFQNNYFSNRYENEQITSVQLDLPFNHILKYLPKDSTQTDYFDDAFNIVTTNNIHPNNISILSPNINELRKIDFCIRKSKHEKTMTMFEPLEIYFKYLLIDYKKHNSNYYNNMLLAFDNDINDLSLFLSYRECSNIHSDETLNLIKKHNIDSRTIHNELIKLDDYQKNEISRHFKNFIQDYRRNKKIHFWMNPGTVKLSTIHSFKGWEIHTLILILSEFANANHPIVTEDNHNEFISDELIYTAITRCRFNLVVVNCGIQRYHDYFARNLNLT